MNSHIQKPRMDSAFLKLAASLTFITLTPALHAVNGTWTGLSGGTWNDTDTNWTGVSGTPWDSTNGPSNAAIFSTASLAASVSGTVYTNGITFNNAGGLIGSGTINLAGTTPTITNSVSATINTILDGTAGLTKSGTGTLTLGGNNTYSGTTTVNAGGILRVDTANALGSTAAGTTVISGAQLRLQNVTIGAEALTISGNGTGSSAGAIRSGNGTNTLNGKVTLAANAKIFSSSGLSITFNPTSGDAVDLASNTLTIEGAGNHTVSGAIVGTGGGLNKIGSGNTTLTGTNTYSGVTTVAGGRLILSGAGRLGSGAISVVNTDAGTLELAVTGNNTMANNISGDGSVVISGSGTTTFTGSNTYSGLTTVSAGTLAVNSNVAGAMTVASGGTLQGNGTISGATTVNGNLKPGNSPGLLTFADSLTLGSTANTIMEITGANSSGTRGATYDAVNVTNALTYGGTLALDFATLFTQGGNYAFNLFDFGSTSGNFTSVSLAGAYSGNFTNNSGIWGLAQGNNTWSFNQGDGVLSFTVVPEPNVAMVAGSLALMALLRRRRD
jgi:autotransporter-associated beta strand protein